MHEEYLISEISDSNSDVSNWHVRRASRGILMLNGKIALLHVTSNNYHKLPGGGVENNETKEEAFVREAAEETGCQCKIKNFGGVVIEYRKEFELVQISYVFAAEVVGTPGKPHLEQGEIDEGHDLEWHSLEAAISLISSENPESYEGGFIRKRDLAILKFFRNKLYRQGPQTAPEY